MGSRSNPTGASLLWSHFNEANLDAMLKSGLVASAGSLVLINELVPVSIWAMNFAMMFALALGIAYALFLVVRFRAV